MFFIIVSGLISVRLVQSQNDTSTDRDYDHAIPSDSERN